MVPTPKLEYLLKHYGGNDAGDKGRKALYKHLYGLLWVCTAVHATSDSLQMTNVRMYV